MDVTFLQQLLDISRQMAENRALDPLLQYTMQNALELIGAERGYLVLVDEDGKLDFRVKIDHEGNELEHPEEQISYSILSKVTRTSRSLVINDAMFDPALKDSDSVQSLQLRSVMCAPLIARERAIGAIYVENRTNANIFEDEDVQPLELFANQAAVAIENAILNDRLEARVAQRTQELKEVNNQLEASWMEAVEANRVRTMILGNVAHDMRSPIALSVSALTAIRDGSFGTLSQKQSQWLERALNALEHAIQLTGDIFDLMKAEMNALVIHREVVDLEGYLMEMKAVGDGIPWHSGVDFRLEIRSALPEAIALDPTRIKQVILNLLSNAQKFTERGEVVLYADLHDDGNNVLIGVKDSGSGIDDAQLAHIFERFRQATPDSALRRAGTGLGLAICRELVERHGGKIDVSSRVGFGTDFYFTLPITQETDPSSNGDQAE